VLAYHALGLLTQLFRYGRLEHHGAFVNVRESRVQPLCINSAIWKKLRRRGRRLMSRSAAQALVSKCS
jgi:hypothetical protein